MKLGQLVKYNKGNIFIEKPCRKWGRENGSRPIFIFKKTLFEVKTSGLELGFNIFRYLKYNKKKTV